MKARHTEKKGVSYVSTYHECICRCGQQFFVRAMRGAPHKTITQCPGCGYIGRVIDRQSHKRVDEVLVCEPTPETRILFEDVPNLEQAIKLYQGQYQLASNHLASLREAVKSAIFHWRNNWAGAVMPLQFKELIRVLNEQSKDVS